MPPVRRPVRVHGVKAPIISLTRVWWHKLKQDR